MQKGRKKLTGRDNRRSRCSTCYRWHGDVIAASRGWGHSRGGRRSRASRHSGAGTQHCVTVGYGRE